MPVGVVGLEPTKPKGGRFTVCSRCRWRTPQCLVEPRGVEPRSMDFQSIAYTKSAKAPLPCCPRWIRTTTCRSRICRANHYTIGHHRAETKGFEPLRRCRLPVFRTGAINQLCQISILVTRERFELPTSTFVASCSNPTELTSHHQRKQEDSNLWNLSVQHVSSVPLSTAQPYFLHDCVCKGTEAK